MPQDCHESSPQSADCPVDGEWQWFWTRMSLPEDLWNIFLLRDDKSIGIQELLAVLLMAETFADMVKHNTWTTWCDNQGVVASLVKGANRVTDANLVIAQFWLWIAKMEVDFEANQVHTHSTVADGPTRERLDIIAELNAQFTGPRLPNMLLDFWSFPQRTDLFGLGEVANLELDAE